MAVSAFEYSNPRVERIVFGRGVVKQLADEARQLGASRVFVVTSPSIAKTYLLDAVRSTLGDLCVGVYDTVKPHSPTDSIARGGEAGRGCVRGRVRERGRRQLHRYRQGHGRAPGRGPSAEGSGHPLHPARQEGSAAHAGAQDAAHRHPDDVLRRRIQLFGRAGGGGLQAHPGRCQAVAAGGAAGSGGGADRPGQAPGGVGHERPGPLRGGGLLDPDPDPEPGLLYGRHRTHRHLPAAAGGGHERPRRHRRDAGGRHTLQHGGLQRLDRHPPRYGPCHRRPVHRCPTPTSMR